MSIIYNNTVIEKNIIIFWGGGHLLMTFNIHKLLLKVQVSKYSYKLFSRSICAMFFVRSKISTSLGQSHQ